MRKTALSTVPASRPVLLALKASTPSAKAPFPHDVAGAAPFFTDTSNPVPQLSVQIPVPRSRPGISKRSQFPPRPCFVSGLLAPHALVASAACRREFFFWMVFLVRWQRRFATVFTHSWEMTTLARVINEAAAQVNSSFVNSWHSRDCSRLCVP